MNEQVRITEPAMAAPIAAPAVAVPSMSSGPTWLVLGGISLSHFLNDTMQSLIPSVYPILKASYALDFTQIGIITLAFNFTSSLLQPVVGMVTDRKAQPFSLAVGMGSTFLGLLLLSFAHQYGVILLAAAMVGMGSAVFHPESARIARLASGGQLWSRAVDLPGRRQCRHCGRTAARGAGDRAVRSAQHRLVLDDRVSRDRHPVQHRPLVQAAHRGEEGRQRRAHRRTDRRRRG